MLRLIHISNQLPVSFPVDPTSTFQPGQIGQLKVMGNEVVCGVSDGTAPFGIIDDINSAAFSAPMIDEVKIVPAIGIHDGYGHYISAIDVKQELTWPSIIRSSFVSDLGNVILNDINGIITVQAGTPLNYDSDGDGIVDSIRVVVSYIYRLANIPGDNTTIGSNRISLWYCRGIFETDQYDTRQVYVVNATLFVNSEGLLTTEQLTNSHPGVALCSGPPSGINNSLEFVWY